MSIRTDSQASSIHSGDVEFWFWHQFTLTLFRFPPNVGTPGDVQWTFNGALAASGQLAVTYQVKLNQ